MKNFPPPCPRRHFSLLQCGKSSDIIPLRSKGKPRKNIRGYSSSVERQLPKLHRWVRLPLSAPKRKTLYPLISKGYRVFSCRFRSRKRVDLSAKSPVFQKRCRSKCKSGFLLIQVRIQLIDRLPLVNGVQVRVNLQCSGNISVSHLSAGLYHVHAGQVEQRAEGVPEPV